MFSCFSASNKTDQTFDHPPESTDSEDYSFASVSASFKAQWEHVLHIIGARRLDISVARYMKLLKLCNSRSQILHDLHDEGYNMNVHGVEMVIWHRASQR